MMAGLIGAGTALALGGVMVLAGAATLMVVVSSAGPARPARVVKPSDAQTAADFLLDYGGRMISLMPEPVMLLDGAARILAANTAARRQFGLTNESVLLSSVLREPDVLNAVFTCAQGGASRVVRFMTLTPHEDHVRAYVTLVAEDGGVNAHPVVMLMLSDETALRRAERLRWDFLANASHELRTPLTALSGFIETLRGHARNDPEARDHFLSIMHTQTARMRRLINDLLSLSRVELYEHVVPSERVDLAAIAVEVFNSLEPIAQDAGVELVLEPVSGPVDVVGVRDELVQVLQNLTENAIKYSSSHRAVRLRVGASPDRSSVETADLSVGVDEARFAILPPPLHDGGFGWVSVADAGPGISRRHLPRLGERFFRADPNSPQAKRGTGLGLAITKHILTRHRGGLLVASVEGKGSSFTMMAPLSVGFDIAAAAHTADKGANIPIID